MIQEDPSTDSKFVADVMLQYLRSLHRWSVPVEAYFLELVVEALAQSGEMAKLHQLVTYRVISDSKPLAFLLLSYEARCPSLFQSGVDILAR
ncbi:putative colon cancer-associated protein Mic1 [Ancylostoma caninum]|uniref:Putative colon cancer-associated protein Mic1 n=1 Tax=Ancylostoma caninum TaxID=29170 RepID=A0A368F012_ANCCA|nr:putative colon cancer-associated protein Mic1 [Ancylostoma caninum]